MRRAIFPGSFDPLTNGHLDIIKRSLPLFDEIIIAVLNNPDKNPMFTPAERCAMIEIVLREIQTDGCPLIVDSFQGLTVDFAKKKKAIAIVRGIRAVSDYEYELQMALMNRKLESRLETVFMLPGEPYSYLSSKLVREIAQHGAPLTDLVPPVVEQRLRAKVL